MNYPEITELPLRGAPFPDESINGFIARIAQLNHFKLAAWVAESAGVEFPKIFYSDDDIQRLASVTGRRFDELRRIAPTLDWEGPNGPVSTLLGHDVPSKAFVRKTRRFCPACMALDSTHHRIAWGLRFARVCAVHNIRLLDRCAACEKVLSWRAGAADKCRCGVDLTYLPNLSVLNPVDPEEVIGPR